MKRKILLVIIAVLQISAASILLAQQSDTGVTAEAPIQANLRAEPGIESLQVGIAYPGTIYPVIGRSSTFPWILLGDPVDFHPVGWVFYDSTTGNGVVTVTGNLANVPITDNVRISGSPSTIVPTISPTQNTPFASTTPPILATPSPTAHFNVTGIVQGEINLRYGPDASYERVGVAQEGDRLRITGWNTQAPWVQVEWEASPTGYAWVYIDLLEIEGDLYSLPSISVLNLNLPTLTPTPPVVQAVEYIDGTPVTLSPEFQTLGNRIWNMMLNAEFDPETSRFGGFFLMDLQTGEAITLGNEFAFSGMSLSKIAILAEIYNLLDSPPDANEATTIANMMICSENSATNAVLSLIGNGDEYLGAQMVTEFYHSLGLENSFMVAPYLIPGISTPQPVRAPDTAVDQIKANPDYSNQMTVDEMGFLLKSIYQCAINESGPLMEGDLAGNFTPGECRSMMRLMSENRIGALIEAGVPAGTFVAHKHGWVDETHGDAGIVRTPGGDYVLVMAFHQPEWLPFAESSVLMAEISREVYNFYNPDAPMPSIREELVPETCEIPPQLLNELMRGDAILPPPVSVAPSPETTQEP